MITLEKIDLYRKYSGDVDACVRTASPHARSIMSDGDWSEISAILQECFLVNAGLASARYTERISDRIAAATGDAATAEALRQLAAQG